MMISIFKRSFARNIKPRVAQKDPTEKRKRNKNEIVIDTDEDVLRFLLKTGLDHNREWA